MTEAAKKHIEALHETKKLLKGRANADIFVNTNGVLDWIIKTEKTNENITYPPK